MRYQTILAILLLIFLFQMGISFANDAPINLDAGGAQALSWPSEFKVEMESEVVKIVLGEKSYIVDATFNFRNKGESTEVNVGFPKNGEGYYDSSFTRTSDFIKFETWVNGVKVSFKEKPNKASIEGSYKLPDLVKLLKQPNTSYGAVLFVKDYRWMVKEKVPFPSNSVTVTRVRYEARYNSSSECKGIMAYTYGTGKYWNGNIGKSTFIVDTTKISLEDRAPQESIYFSNEEDKSKAKCSTLKDGVFQYEINDYKPKSSDDWITVSIGCTHWD